MEELIGPLVLVAVALFARLGRRPNVHRGIQPLFEEFHSKIQLDEHFERRKLREKRETLLNVLKEKLSPIELTFVPFLQGSYAMRTGVVPKNGNYDIDVGLIFTCGVKRFPDPLVLKRIVHDAMDMHNRTVRIRRPCVTVTYQKDGVPEFHVDLAIYMKQPDGSLLIGMGHETSKAEERKWKPAAPAELKQFILSKVDGEAQAQLRRCIRYLKRWRDENFIVGAPLSIALTVAAARWFEPKTLDDGTHVDLEALLHLVKTMQGKFELGWSTKKLVVNLPGPVKGNLMEGLSPLQMTSFSEQLDKLAVVLQKCTGDVQLCDSASALALIFGSDFPMPVARRDSGDFCRAGASSCAAMRQIA